MSSTLFNIHLVDDENSHEQQDRLLKDLVADLVNSFPNQIVTAKSIFTEQNEMYDYPIGAQSPIEFEGKTSQYFWLKSGLWICFHRDEKGNWDLEFGEPCM